jgi:acid phosphatase (class A)
MRKACWPFALIFVLTLTTPLLAAEAKFLTLDRFDLTKVLPPPPAPDSEQQKRDLAAVLAVQKSRTPAQTERALADVTAGTFGFADVLGPNFTAQRVPAVAALFDKIRGDAGAALSAGQSVWKRARPFAVSAEVEPVGDRPGGSSYPSVSSTVGYLGGIVLADMVPEKAAALYARGREFGDNRIVLGVHFPTDIEAGRLAATAVATALMENPAFIKEFDEARAQLRKALGL